MIVGQPAGERAHCPESRASRHAVQPLEASRSCVTTSTLVVAPLACLLARRVKRTTLGSTQVGWVAEHWLAADLGAAQANPAITGIYIFGHKPLVAPGGASDGALNDALVGPIEQLIDSTPKVKGYFNAHVHEWSSTQLPGTRGVWQIVAGNGGSQLETTWSEPHPYFGFTLVNIYASGKVGVVSYGRPASSPYNSPTSTAALPSPEITIAH